MERRKQLTPEARLEEDGQALLYCIEEPDAVHRSVSMVPLMAFMLPKFTTNTASRSNGMADPPLNITMFDAWNA
ncbi:unnamed protein product [Clonostachys rhizophaga]|uniref:Uncharacterized protein n=1 Tax=Clonostachys rhizophaga TaxID=160324 RepID=A0A9N9VBG0_9HYPO|nr:unnamed protein product [Clonostachys rhizophaga]